MTTTPTLSNPSLSPVNTSSEAIEKLNVFAYLTPDPYCEDGDFESEWVERLAILKMVKYALEISNKDFLKFLKVQKVTPDSIVNPVLVNSN